MPDPIPALSSSVIVLEPLPAPTANPALPRIRRDRRSRSGLAASPAALIPLLYAALLYFAGIALAHSLYLRPAVLLAGLVPLAVVAAFAIWKAPRLSWLSIGAIWLVLGVWSAETEPAPAPDPTIAQLSDGLLRTVEGMVIDAGPLHTDSTENDMEDREPEADRDEIGRKMQSVDLQVTAAEVVTDGSDSQLPVPLKTKIRLLILWPAGDAAPAVCGQRIRAVIRMLPPETFHDPGVWSRAEYLEGQQINASASVTATKRDTDSPRYAIIGSPNATSVSCLLNRMRNSASAQLESLPLLTRSLPHWLRATPEDAAMLTALLTGDRTSLTRSLRTGFERTGSFHLIVVSGLHLAILAGCIFALARRLRLGRFPATALTLAISLAYALFTGFAIPAQRSFWMIALYLLGRLVYRNRSPLNVIGFAALCLAAASPRSIFDASLQMTLLSVTAIAGIALPLLEPTLHARLRATQKLRLIALDAKLSPEIAQFRVSLRLLARHLEAATDTRIAWQLFPFALRSVLRLCELLFVTMVVELALALPMAIYFHRITVYALPVNLCILPLLGILLPAAMILLLVVAVWPGAAIFPAAVCLTILHLSVSLVRTLGTLSLGDLHIPEPTALQAGIAILLFILTVQLVRGSVIHRRLSFAALVAATSCTLWPRVLEHPRDALLFEAIDVGQGDSLLLITPEGKTLLVDGGGLGFGFNPAASGSGHSEFDIGEEVVSPVLWSRGIRHLDAVALTHAHHDHMGGLPAILRNFHPTELWIGNNPPVAAYETLLDQARSLGVRIRTFHAGDRTSLGGVDFRILAPDRSYHPGSLPANNDSLVLQARYRETSILLAGDAEAPEEQAILTEPELQSTVLKVGHHGSLSSTRPAFLSAVAPSWAVISCGLRNRFGHPRPEILAELQAAHTRTFRTDLDGVSCLRLDGKSVTPEPMCGVDRERGP